VASGLAANDRLQTTSRHQAAISLAYDVTPLWRVDTLMLTEFAPHGVFIRPSVRYNARENLDISAFMQWISATNRSIFSLSKPLFSVQVDWYF
jgi:hypothetical protein